MHVHDEWRTRTRWRNHWPWVAARNMFARHSASIGYLGTTFRTSQSNLSTLSSSSHTRLTFFFFFGFGFSWAWAAVAIVVSDFRHRLVDLHASGSWWWLWWHGVPSALSAIIAIHDIKIVIRLSKNFLIWKFLKLWCTMQRSLVLDTNSIVYMGTWTLLASPYALLIWYKFLVGRDKNILLYSWHGIASTCTMHTVCLVDCNNLVSHSHFLFVRIKYMYMLSVLIMSWWVEPWRHTVGFNIHITWQYLQSLFFKF